MMNKNFILSYYKNASEGIHIQKANKSEEAQKPHTHDYFQIYYIIKGSLTHYTENDSSNLSKGDVFIIPPKRSHYISKINDDVLFYSFSFMEDSLGITTDSNRFVIDFLKSLLVSESVYAKITVPSSEMLFVENLMEQIYKEFNERKPGYGEIIHSSAISLIAIFARNYKHTNNMIKASDNKHLMLHCIEYIKKNSAEDITLSNMAKYSAMSESYFYKLFSELTGMSFNNYLNTCRIKKSLEYIKKGYKSTAVYGLCGFNDYATFYRNFKKIMGMSPAEYKINRE